MHIVQWVYNFVNNVILYSSSHTRVFNVFMPHSKKWQNMIISYKKEIDNDRYQLCIYASMRLLISSCFSLLINTHRL